MSFLINEDFEGAGTPTGWTGSGSADFDWTVAPLQGAQSLHLDDATGDSTIASLGGTEYTEIWTREMMRWTTLPSSSAQYRRYIDNSFNQLNYLFIFSDGRATLDFITYAPAGSVAVNTTYFLFTRIKAGSGINAEMEVWLNTADDRAGSPVHLTTLVGTWTTGVGKFYCGYTLNGGVVIIDTVQIADTDQFAGGGGALVGTAAITFDATGTISGSGALIATSAITFTATGAISGKGALTSASSVLFAASGGINATGALIASSAITFDGIGSLNGGVGQLVGTSVITFSTSGTLSGKGAFAATSAITFTATGTISGKGALTASSAVLFTASAVTSPGAMLGRCNIYFDAYGEMHGCYRYQGCVTSDFNYTPDGTAACGSPYSGCNVNDFGYQL